MKREAKPSSPLAARAQRLRSLWQALPGGVSAFPPLRGVLPAG